jgi:hypothetical protein
MTAVSVKIAAETRPASVGANTMSAMPARRAMGAAPKCSHPRKSGLSIVGVSVVGFSAINLRYRRLGGAGTVAVRPADSSRCSQPLESMG